MKVEYSKRAVSDLRKIAEYHRHSDNPVIGERIAVGIGRLSAASRGHRRAGAASFNGPAFGLSRCCGTGI